MGGDCLRGGKTPKKRSKNRIVIFSKKRVILKMGGLEKTRIVAKMIQLIVA